MAIALTKKKIYSLIAIFSMMLLLSIYIFSGQNYQSSNYPQTNISISLTISYNITEQLEQGFVYQPNITGNITNYEIREMVFNQLRYFIDNFQDKKYLLTTKNDIEMFVENHTESFDYKKDYYDCDDFAIRLYGQFTIPNWSALPIGYAKFKTDTGYHGALLFVDNEYKIWIIDYYRIKEIPSNWELLSLWI